VVGHATLPAHLAQKVVGVTARPAQNVPPRAASAAEPHIANKILTIHQLLSLHTIADYR